MDALAIATMVKDVFGGALLAVDQPDVEPVAVIEPEKVAEVARFLRETPGLAFDYLMCLSGFDTMPAEEDHPARSTAVEDAGAPVADSTEPTLGVAYHLFSYSQRHRFAFKAHTPRKNPHIPSVTQIWPAADWHEREAFDLFGIIFDGHPDLRRILLPEDWVGHPLRKDYAAQESYRIGDACVQIARGW
ncbi:MAG TPA: NADH-quinone oxidoreductase subunit C [Candidatus Latescibacteria bacterium]|nr:NADH-quinone oxidoreductase subunit C [Candidatus Latescibacterota bacterium]